MQNRVHIITISVVEIKDIIILSFLVTLLVILIGILSMFAIMDNIIVLIVFIYYI